MFLFIFPQKCFKYASLSHTNVQNVFFLLRMLTKSIDKCRKQLLWLRNYNCQNIESAIRTSKMQSEHRESKISQLRCSFCFRRSDFRSSNLFPLQTALCVFPHNCFQTNLLRIEMNVQSKSKLLNLNFL